VGQIFLVRHGLHSEIGQVLSGRSEIALSQEGERQALALAAMMADVPIASLHSSPRRRALATIAPLAAQRRLAVRQSAALDEIDFGAFTGRPFAALADDPAWARWNAQRGRARCPGGETMAEAVGRALAYLRSLSPADLPALCVTHCDIIRGVLADLDGRNLNRLFDIACDPGSVTTLRVDGSSIRPLSINVPVRPARLRDRISPLPDQRRAAR